ncbi:unnamed protein product [Meloidogyne enterolobii]|uniref:Uncharacterized protein n=1 Tax=Meloidogyne enterolobii TaxID=390850 RepID=A0ACB0ZFQ4_MELEN
MIARAGRYNRNESNRLFPFFSAVGKHLPNLLVVSLVPSVFSTFKIFMSI